MRFVLSFILSSYFLITPFPGNAGEVSGKSIKASIENNTPGSKLIGYSISDDHEMAINRFSHRNSTTNQFRPYSFTNLINTVADKKDAGFLYETKLNARPHLYCKRIGLKLVFPEHYFW